MRRIPCFTLLFLLVPAACGAAADLAELPRLIEALKDKNSSGRRFALYNLEELGLDAAVALPEILRALDDPDKSLRKGAADALGAIGPEAAPAIPRLVALLGEGGILRVNTDVGGFFDVCLHAAWALGRMAPEAVGPLARALEHPKGVVRYHAALALSDIGPNAKAAVPGLVRLFKDRDEMIRMMAVDAVRKIGPDAKAVLPAVLQRLKDRHLGTRRAAVDALGTLRPLTREALDGLIRALGDKDGLVQRHAAGALGALGADAAPAVPALCAALTSRKSYPHPEYHPFGTRPVAAAVAEALGRIGPAAKSAMPSLLAAARDTKFSYIEYTLPKKTDLLQSAAARAAAQVEPQNKELLGLLEEYLRDPEDLADGTIFALAKIGPRAQPLLPLVLDRMGWTNPRQRLALACAAIHIEPRYRAAIDTVVSTLNPDDLRHDEQWELLRLALRLAGPQARRVIPALTETLASERWGNVEATRTLGQFGPAARIAVPVLIDALADRGDERREAIEALKRITQGEPRLLRGAMRHHSVEVRCGLIEVLGSSPGSVEELVGLLRDPSARVRLAAVTALGRLGKPAKKAIPYVKACLDDERPTIRQAARKTLNQLKK